MEITQAILKELFDYRGGFLYWKIYAGTVKPGKIAGTIDKYICPPLGRRRIRINKKGYLASRLIFCWHKGYMPEFVDHIDRNGLNDKIENLRECTQSQNAQNRTLRNSSKTKYKGVNFIIKANRWRTNIFFNGKQIQIGVFETEEFAALAYNKAAVKYFGEFANLNIIKP